MSFVNNEINMALEMCKLIKPKFPEAKAIRYGLARKDPRDKGQEINQYYITFTNQSRIVTNDCAWVKIRTRCRIIYGCGLDTVNMLTIMNTIKDCLITTCNNPVPDGFEKKIRKIVETDEQSEFAIDDVDNNIVFEFYTYIIHPNFTS